MAPATPATAPAAPTHPLAAGPVQPQPQPQLVTSVSKGAGVAEEGTSSRASGTGTTEAVAVPAAPQPEKQEGQERQSEQQGSHTVPLPAPAAAQSAAPIWARIYPVAQPPFEQVLQGHPRDYRTPHAGDLSPASQVSEEEKAAREADVAEKGKANDEGGAAAAAAPRAYEHAWALPHHDQRYRSVWHKQPHLAAHEHADPALRALGHGDREAFLHKDQVEVEDLSPRFGSIVRGAGLDLGALTPDELDELALFVTQRGVVMFEDQQGFVHAGPEALLRFARHFSCELHQHPVAPEVKGFPELLPIYRPDTASTKQNQTGAHKDTLGTVGWHSDITFEAQPPGITALLMLDPSESGGDTGFADAEELYRRLSPFLRRALTGLWAEHDFFRTAGTQQAFGARPAKRLPVAHAHPAVRTHPVTGRQALFVNEVFTARLVGLKAEESAALLGLLGDLAARAADAQVRVRWRPGAVALWDNRRTQHRIVPDVLGRRHALRLTPQAERPFYARTAYDDELDELDRE